MPRMPIWFDRPPQRPSSEQPKRLSRPLESSPNDAALAREKAELQEHFDRRLRGNFREIRGGDWESNLPGVDSLSIVPTGGRDPTVKDVRQLFIIPYSTDAHGRPRHDTFTLTEDGALLGRIPKHLAGITRADLLRRTLEIADALDVGTLKIFNINREILPEGAWPTPPTNEIVDNGPDDGGGGGDRKPVLDPKRFALLRKLGARFGFVNERKGGFNSYTAFVFDRCAVLEHPKTRNAAYFIDFAEALNPDDIPRTDEAFERWLTKNTWVDALKMTKYQARQAGMVYIEHRGDWDARMTEEITTRHR